MDGTGKLLPINDLKAFLQGEWNLERRVQDRRAGEDGALIGAATFAAAGSDLLYREEGRLVIGDHNGPALQSYRYAFSGPARATVSFNDGRYFHDLDLSSGAWACTHLCDPDRYDGDFSALGGDALRVVWTVTGPRKHLVLDSRYRRRL